MIANLTNILIQTGKSVVGQIQHNLEVSGTNATKKTSNSLHFTITEEGPKLTLTVSGRKYFTAVETGRKATPDKKPSREFVTNIAEWLKAKNIKASPYAVATAINNKGTKLKQSGGRRDIISNVINQTLFDKISKSILESYSKAVITNIKHVYGNSSK